MKTDPNNVDRERLMFFEAALRLAIQERTGADPGEINGLELGSYMPIDAERAFEILKKCYQD